MKERQSFVSNSSSCSFVVSASELPDVSRKALERLVELLENDEYPAHLEECQGFLKINTSMFAAPIFEEVFKGEKVKFGYFESQEILTMKKAVRSTFHKPTYVKPGRSNKPDRHEERRRLSKREIEEIEERENSDDPREN